MTALEKKIIAAYKAVPEYIREDMVEAAIWARDTLMRHEGAGHHFELTAEADGLLCCSFAKAEWSGDHAGEPMPTASEAIVRAVCEYLCGA